MPELSILICTITFCLYDFLGGNMFSIYIKYFFLIFNTLYISEHISTTSIVKFPKYLLMIMRTILISVFVYFFLDVSLSSKFIIMFALIYLFSFIHTNRPVQAFLTTAISFSLSFSIYILATSITCILFLSYYKNASSIPYNMSFLPSGIIQTLLSITIFRSGRISKGIAKLIHRKSILTNISISILPITSIVLLSINRRQTTQFTRDIAILSFLLLAIFTIHYWKNSITQTYRVKLCLANEKSLENEISNLKDEIRTLQTDNRHLTQIVHKDNKLVPSMETTVLEFLQSAKVLSTEELVTLGDELSRTLHEMARERAGILTSLSSTNNSMPSSGLIAIDGLLSYMEKRAAESNINYKVKMDDNIKELILTALNEDDLRHLLGDLIENAIIATNYSELPKHISIHLGSLQDKFLLEISDSGIPFNPETYQYFGYEHCSTHQEDGGTGTGLMDIWSIKKKYKESLYIYEYESSSNNIYTKKISFLFDGKNHFLLKTYRDKEIKNSLIRGDLHVFPHEAE